MGRNLNLRDIASKKCQMANIPKDFDDIRQYDDTWNFQKCDNEIKHPGNIPGQVPPRVKMILYSYTLVNCIIIQWLFFFDR